MGEVEYFSPSEERVTPGDCVIIRTKRGVEWGKVVARQNAPDEEPAGQILRRATRKDTSKQKEIQEGKEEEEFQVCRELIEHHELPMKLVKVEHLFGSNKIIFFFLADGRVDFRNLVKDLAKRYRTRIEMRQVGVRDEAKLLGGFGSCGRPLCCRKFLRALKPVPMKVAKNQKSTLDPAKISGRCGRLKCCLKYENGIYRELKANLPRPGTGVRTPAGDGVVVGYEILKQTVNVRFEDDNERSVPVEEIEIVENEKTETQ
ncbi:MAG: stage 0 sporulation protein [Planctomycetes bacterium]|nr:stage 0 sporulation protein [Planctomycetota bacterium]